MVGNAGKPGKAGLQASVAEEPPGEERDGGEQDDGNDDGRQPRGIFEMDGHGLPELSLIHI